MTAPQKYSVQEEKESVENSGNLKEKEDRYKLICEKINSALLDSECDLGSLEVIGSLMIDAESEVDSSCIGSILQDYIKKIREGLGQVEVLICKLRRELND